MRCHATCGNLGLRVADTITIRLERLMNEFIEDALIDVEPEDIAAVGDVNVPVEDRHVLAAVVAADADIHLAENVRPFPRAWMIDHGVAVLTAGELITRLGQQFPDKLRAAHAATVRYSPKSETEVLATLEAIIGNGAAHVVRRLVDNRGSSDAAPCPTL